MYGTRINIISVSKTELFSSEKHKERGSVAVATLTSSEGFAAEKIRLGSGNLY